jgi:hypothetical protein
MTSDGWEKFNAFCEEAKVAIGQGLKPMNFVRDGQVTTVLHPSLLTGILSGDSAFNSAFLRYTLFSYFDTFEVSLYPFRCYDTNYRAFRVNHDVIQYLAIDIVSKTYICWSDAELDGLPQDQVTATVLMHKGIDAEVIPEADGSSVIKIYNGGKIQKIETTFDTGGQKVISVNGVEIPKERYPWNNS